MCRPNQAVSIAASYEDTDLVQRILFLAATMIEQCDRCGELLQHTTDKLAIIFRWLYSPQGKP
jgi:hypothetical protein